MSRRLNPSEKLLIGSLVFAAAAVGAIWWFIPGFAWWVYVGGGAVLWVSCYNSVLRTKANERMVDGPPKT